MVRLMDVVAICGHIYTGHCRCVASATGRSVLSWPKMSQIAIIITIIVCGSLSPLTLLPPATKTPGAGGEWDSWWQNIFSIKGFLFDYSMDHEPSPSGACRVFFMTSTDVVDRLLENYYTIRYVDKPYSLIHSFVHLFIQRVISQRTWGYSDICKRKMYSQEEIF